MTSADESESSVEEFPKTRKNKRKKVIVSEDEGEESDVKFLQVNKFKSNIIVDDIIVISDISEDETEAAQKTNSNEDIKFWKVSKFNPPIRIHDVVEISDDDDDDNDDDDD